MQLIVNNDEMLGRTTDKTLHLALIEKDKKIERLTAESTEWESKCYKYQDIINELDKLISIKIIREANEEDYHIDINDMVEIKTKLLELKEGK